MALCPPALAMLAPGPAGRPLRLIASAYVDIFRAIPAVLVIYLVGFGVPLTGVPSGPASTMLVGVTEAGFSGSENETTIGFESGMFSA